MLTKKDALIPKTNGTPSLEKLQVETTKDTHADAEKMLDRNI